jgi:hypothetical protein
MPTARCDARRIVTMLAHHPSFAAVDPFFLS